jgi:NAD(P)-dependent dehydrogenase (short-subunit alcohol dehydrogenase family)
MMEDFLTNPASLFSVRDKVAVVTGASGAFGALAAKVLAGAGAKLMLAAGKTAELQQVEQDCIALGAEVAGINRRPDDEAACAAIVAAAVEKFGAVDILVVASGMNDVAPITTMSPERSETVMHANVTGSWLMARAAGARMLEQGRGGKIVLMSSARGLLGHPAGYSAYCASKSAVDGITRALGCEWGPHGITVNAIAPTVFRSALTAWMFEDTERGTATRTGMLARIPKGRLGEPSDLAGPLVFLASAASDFYTGHIHYADGGYTAG